MFSRSFGIFKNYLLLSGGEMIGKIITFAAIAFLARVLGPGGYGYVEYASSVLLCASLIVDQGFNLYGAREIARDPGRTHELVSEIVFIRIFLAILAYLGVVAFTLTLSPSPTHSILLLVFSLSLFGLPFILLWVFQGYNQMGVVSITQILRQAAYALMIFLFVRTLSQIWMVGLAEIAGVCAAAIFSISIYFSRFRHKILNRPVFTRQLFREGVPIGLSQIFWTLRVYGATVIIGVIATPAETGYFGGAMRIMVALHTFIYLYFFNLLPTMSSGWKAQDGTFPKLITNSLHLVSWIGVLLSIPAIILSPAIMTTVYGKAFAPAGTALQWMIMTLFLVALDGHYRFGLVATINQNVEMAVSALGAALALILIPTGYRLAGIDGAAAALFLVEIFIWVSSWWFSKIKMDLSGQAKVLVRPFLAFLFTVAVVLILPFSSRLVNSIAAFSVVLLFAFVFDSRVRSGLGTLVKMWSSR